MSRSTPWTPTASSASSSYTLETLADGRTIVFTSHNAPDIEELATRHCRIESHRLEPVR